MTVQDDLTLIREALEEFLPDGYRDDDGVWHDGPIQAESLAALARVEARLVGLETLADATEDWFCAHHGDEEKRARDAMRDALAVVRASQETP